MSYSTNDDLIFSTGASIDDFFDAALDAAAISIAKDKVREKAFNKINSHLEGLLPLPASSVEIPILKDVEVDLSIAFLIRDGYVLQTPQTSDWQPLYEKALEDLKDIKFDAQATVETGNENIGNGTLQIISVNKNYAFTEQFMISANNATQFNVTGSVTGILPTATVDIQYPERNWVNYGVSTDYGGITGMQFSHYPFTFIINSGPIPFEVNDYFLVNTFKSSWRKIWSNKIELA